MIRLLIIGARSAGKTTMAKILENEDVVIIDNMPKIKLGQAGSQRDSAFGNRVENICNTGSNKSNRKRNRKNRWS